MSTCQIVYALFLIPFPDEAEKRQTTADGSSVNTLVLRTHSCDYGDYVCTDILQCRYPRSTQLRKQRSRGLSKLNKGAPSRRVRYKSLCGPFLHQCALSGVTLHHFSLILCAISHTDQVWDLKKKKVLRNKYIIMSILLVVTLLEQFCVLFLLIFSNYLFIIGISGSFSIHNVPDIGGTHLTYPLCLLVNHSKFIQ